MRKVLTLTGIVLFLVSCGNTGTGTSNTDTATTDTVAAPNTTNYGGAGTSGVGAGFGAGNRAGADTNLPLSADSARVGAGNR
jgi:hypothetical protein